MTDEGGSTQIVCEQSEGRVALSGRKSSPIKAGKARPSTGSTENQRPKYVWLLLLFALLLTLGGAYYFWYAPASGWVSQQSDNGDGVNAAESGSVSGNSVVREIAPASTEMTKPIFTSAMEEAEYAWKTGELVEAITLVKLLSKEVGGESASVRLRHYTRVVLDYEALSRADPGSDYAGKVTDFYLALDPVEDAFFWQHLETDFGQLLSLVTVEEAQEFLQALKAQNPEKVPDSLNTIFDE